MFTSHTVAAIINMFGGGVSLVSILAIIMSVIISLTLHEYAHGYVAYKNGDNTAKYSGRISLNPMKHFDGLGFLSLVFVGFGFAKPVPVNINNFRKRRVGIFTVAIAGVVVNIILAIVSVFFSILILKIGFSSNGFNGRLFEFLYTFFQYMSILNLSLVFFNLLPIFPLDGFRVVEAFTKYNNSYTKWMRNYGIGLLMVLIVLSMLVQVFSSLPYWFDLISVYLEYTAMKVYGVLVKFFVMILGI